MGKISMDRDAKKGSLNSMKLPPMQVLKPLPEIVTVSDSPLVTKSKYVSPLSLAWKRKLPIEDNLPQSSPPKVASDCQATAVASTITSVPTTEVATITSSTSCEPDKLECVDEGTRSSWLSEGAFNISRIAASSSPIVLKKPTIDNAGLKKPISGENDLGKELPSNPIFSCDATASLIPRKYKKNKKKRYHNMVEALPANSAGHSLEDQASNCTILAEKIQAKEKKDSGKIPSSVQENTNIKQRPCEIETIDLDVSNGIEVLAIKKLSKKTVDFVDLSCTQDAVVSAPITDDSVIVIDEDHPYEMQKIKYSAKQSKEKCKNKKKDKLLQRQPHTSLMKKKERRRKKGLKVHKTQMPNILGEDDICFLGTGISLRPPKPTAVINPGVSQPSARAGRSAQNSGPAVVPPPSIYGSNFDNPNGNVPQRGLRPIVIDGSNVAMGHGKKENMFSSKGIEICVNYFLKRGHKVYCFIPQYRMSDPCTKDRQILTELEKQGHLICTPSRYVGSNAIVPYDDRYIVQIAAELGGVIISRDNYRDLIAENPAFKETIVLRTLMYTWVGDIIMFPSDPLGRRNVSLDSMLRF